MGFAKYESYKESGVAWLNMIPKHWQVQPGMVCLSESKEKNRGMIEDTVLSLSYGKIIVKPEEKLTGLVPESFETYQIVNPHDIIIRPTDLQNDKTSLRTGISHNRGIITSAYLCLRPNGITDPFFLHYLLHAYDLMKVYYGMGSGLRQNLDYRDFKRLPIVIPNIDEQQRIATFLDQKTAEIDEAIAKKQQLIELLQEQKAILINQAVTKGLNPDVPMQDSGVDWIGEVPTHWKTMMVKRIARNGYKTFTDGDWVEAPFITDEGIRLIQTGNIGRGEYKEKGFRYISEASFAQLNCCEVFPNDVLICRLDGPVGRACLAPDLGVRMITSVDNAILKPSDDFDPRFIVYSMSSDLWLEWIQAICRAGGGFRFRISRSMLGELRIAAPPVDEQRSIADHLDSELAEIHGVVNKLEVGINALNYYRQTLISEAVTGKIKV